MQLAPSMLGLYPCSARKAVQIAWHSAYIVSDSAIKYPQPMPVRVFYKCTVSRANSLYVVQAASAFTRALSREILRDAVFLWSTPRVTPRCNSGWAARKAARAESTSPEAIAISTFFTKVRIRLMRAPLITARLALRIIRFLDDL